MPPRVLVFQHAKHETLGYIESALQGLSAEIHTVNFWNGDSIPALRDFNILIVMGGPMGVYDEEQYPWLAAEMTSIREAVTSDMPFLGICLGAQLLAKALGAKVYQNPTKEIGFFTIEFTKATVKDPIFQDAPKTLEVFQWHGDTFDLPPGASLLATGKTCHHQVFRYGNNAYGLQPHFETTPVMISEWIRLGKQEIAGLRDPFNTENQIRTAQLLENDMEQLTRKIIERLLSLVATKT